MRDSGGASHDQWLLPILEEVLPPNAIEALRTAGEGSLWRAAVGLGFVGDAELVSIVASRLHATIAPHLSVTVDARNALPEQLARKYHVLPLRCSPLVLDIATSNPCDIDCERTLAFASGRSVRMSLASPTLISERLDEVYGRGRGTNGSSALSAEPIVRLVDRIVSRGIEERASDVHLEPEEDGIAVRFRVDGLLRHAMLLPKAVGVSLVSRIKIMARLDIADRLRPQSGRASVGAPGSRVDLRVSTLPASHGEKVVIRILDPRSAIRSMESLGLDAIDAPRMHDLLELREGLVLVTGPTGSGKTTTLYAVLREIRRRGLNIITVEDPVEYRIAGIVQVQINDKAGLSFASALRSILRQDPDVVLIGEIRDRETAAIAIQASLTGHLVFATLHTNDACTSVTRLTDLGVDSAKLAAALKGIVAQRLIRRLCRECRVVANCGVPARLRPSVPGDVMVHIPVGCERCTMSGYRGRLAVTEIVLAGTDFERGIAAGASLESLATAARRGGMRSLWESGVAHLVAGETSADELLRVLDQQVSHSSDEPGERQAVSPATPAERGVRYDSADDATPPVRHAPHDAASVTSITAGVVDVYVIRPLAEGWQVLAVQRGPDTRCPGSWETVHGHLDANERPEDGAVREVREETGLQIARLYNVTVQPFYLHTFKAVQLAVVFAAFVDEPVDVSLGEEHQRFEWLSPHEAAARFVWPREREALLQIEQLLSSGDAGPVEDVLRVF